MSLKIIVTNKTSLTSKYSSAGFIKIEAELARMVLADAKRGISTSIYYLDSTDSMQPAGVKPLTLGSSEKQCKDTIDRLYEKLKPEYIMILGAVDVIPQQELKNLASGSDDLDKTVPSDLPYACNYKYSQDPRNFIGPTRVVGRLPDTTGANDAQDFLSVIRNARTQKSKSLKSYQDYFALTTQIWVDSTRQSVLNIFGTGKGLRKSPPSGPKWSAQTYSKLAHYVNCHGAPSTPIWMGQQGGKYPAAMMSHLMIAKIKKGTVAAAECCYGAELYAPFAPEMKSICNTYMEEGAAAFLGSSTLAYGPLQGQKLSDLITQYFVINVLQGASVGRAILEARLKYTQDSGPSLDPFQLKTISQFNLMGDPSVHPVSSSKHDTSLPDWTTTLEFIPSDQNRRWQRRKSLHQKGTLLAASAKHIVEDKVKPKGNAKKVIDHLVSSKGLKRSSLKSYSCKRKSSLESTAFQSFQLDETQRKYHVMTHSRENGSKDFSGKLVVAYVVAEENDNILSVDEYHSK